MTKAIIYLRKSTDREDKQKLSIDGQLQECQKIAAKNNLDVLEVIEDRQTAKEPGRPGFTEMMTKIGKGLASQVICWKSDRLARNPIDAGTIEWAVQNGNIQAIHSSDGVFRTGDNVLMLKMHFGMSTQFIIDLRKNVMRGMKQKLENGGVVQPAPFGYRNNRLDKTVEISEKNSKIVKELFHRRAKGWEFSELAKYSKERGFNFTPGRIESMLKNHFYYGMMKFAWEYYQGSYEPLVSKAIFNQAKNIGRGTYHRENHDKIYFRGKVRCYETGDPLTCSIAKGKYVYYHDHSDYKKRTGNTPRRINQNQILKAYESRVEYYKIPEDMISFVRKGFAEYFGDELNRTQDARKQIQKGLDKLTEKKDNLMDMRSDGEINKEEFIRKKDQVRAEESNLLLQLAECANIDEHILDRFDDFVELLENLSQSYISLSDEKKGQLINMLSVELLIDKEKRLHIAEHELFRNLFSGNVENWQSGSESNWDQRLWRPLY